MRHGLPGLALALAFVAIPALQAHFIDSLERAMANPVRYALWAVVIFIGLNLYAWRTDRHWDLSKLGWIAYLGILSLWEEWVFRIAIPQTLEGLGASIWLAAALSAIAFGSAHYFTLRWKWQWCVGAMIGGLSLSRPMEMQGDLLLITAFHWIATTWNTPRPPGQSRRLGDDTG